MRAWDGRNSLGWLLTRHSQRSRGNWRWRSSEQEDQSRPRRACVRGIDSRLPAPGVPLRVLPKARSEVGKSYPVSVRRTPCCPLPPYFIDCTGAVSRWFDRTGSSRPSAPDFAATPPCFASASLSFGANRGWRMVVSAAWSGGCRRSLAMTQRGDGERDKTVGEEGRGVEEERSVVGGVR